MTSVATELGRVDESRLWEETRQAVIDGIGHALDLEPVKTPATLISR
jgi:hypothetical protein